jgi:hypothetical protein
LLGGALPLTISQLGPIDPDPDPLLPRLGGWADRGGKSEVGALTSPRNDMDIPRCSATRETTDTKETNTLFMFLKLNRDRVC